MLARVLTFIIRICINSPDKSWGRWLLIFVLITQRWKLRSFWTKWEIRRKWRRNAFLLHKGEFVKVPLERITVVLKMLQFPLFFAFSMLSFDSKSLKWSSMIRGLLPSCLLSITFLCFFPFIVLTLMLYLGHFSTDFSLPLTKPDMW